MFTDEQDVSNPWKKASRIKTVFERKTARRKKDIMPQKSLKKSLHLLILAFWIVATPGCLSFFQPVNLLGMTLGGLDGATDSLGGTNSAADSSNDSTSDSLLDFDELSESEANLMSEGPMSLPVTMSKLDAIDHSKIEVTVSPVDEALANLPFVREALAEDECEIGELCNIMVTGLAGAVEDPEETPYVMLYLDGEAVVVEANADGSFDEVSLEVEILEDTEQTDTMTLVSLTEDDLDVAYSSLPLYFKVGPDGTVEFMFTNAASEILTDTMWIDNFSNIYYAVSNGDGTFDLWRQGVGEFPLLLLDDSNLEILKITSLDDHTVVFLLENGSLQYVNIGENPDIDPNVNLSTSSATEDGGAYVISEARELALFENLIGKDRIPYELFPMGDQGILVAKAPSEETNYLAGFIKVDDNEDLVIPLVPFRDLQGDIMIRDAKVAVGGDKIYVMAEFDQNPGFYELSRMTVGNDFEGSLQTAWPNREILIANFEIRLRDVGATDDSFFFSGINPTNGFLEFYQWREQENSISKFWGPEISAGLPEDLGAHPGMMVSPNGKFVLSCANVRLDRDEFEREERLEILEEEGTNIIVHRFGIDEPGVFHTMVRQVDFYSCPDGMAMTKDYELFFYTLGVDNTLPQLSSIDLKKDPLVGELLDDLPQGQ